MAGGRAEVGDSGIVSRLLTWVSDVILLDSFGGLAKYAGVVAIEDSVEDGGLER